jgi:ABC-type transporter Mla subunit MlaD
MRIRKFNEDIQDISSDRVQEIIKNLSELSVYINEKRELIDSLLNELNNFQDKSKSKNDQIDDSVSNLQIVKGYLDDSLDKVDNVVNNMKDYEQSGRKFLY